ncbi:ThuA domain-containing protein [Paraconexibacter algicola]|uniref:Crp/Fnr family transcriptional regulator n=1 Tax=Paraconexibacter algicola TaxID=2133960 RepID=A0A2T4UHR9_9ACTN|nr:ThuA domain-containing protein [Paraconexibacter algicola]PTL58783.1 Crp/Fnr family transcriptional regulator [Paraconexibacter algicola]
MRPLLRAALLAATVLLAGAPAASAAPAPPAGARAAAEPFDVLVFTRTNGYRHASIPLGVALLRDLGARHGFRVRTTEEYRDISDAGLADVEVVAFVNTVGDVLDDLAQDALRRFVERGGAFFGLHAAADTEHGWPWYRELVGGEFLAHPLEQLGIYVNEAPLEPATSHLPARFAVFDEFYSFRLNPRDRVRVLLSIDERTYLPDPNTTDIPGPGVVPASGRMGDHPMAWCQDLGRGRSFYTALGHEVQLYALPWFRRHVLGGVLTAARRLEADCTSPAQRRAAVAAQARRQAAAQRAAARRRQAAAERRRRAAARAPRRPAG